METPLSGPGRDEPLWIESFSSPKTPTLLPGRLMKLSPRHGNDISRALKHSASWPHSAKGSVAATWSPFRDIQGDSLEQDQDINMQAEAAQSLHAISPA